MKIKIGLSNFSFDNQNFTSFSNLKDQFEKLKKVKNSLNDLGLEFSLAIDIYTDDYFGQSINVQFNNFLFGRDRMAVSAFKSLLERNYFNGYEKKYTTSELKTLSSSTCIDNEYCCTLYAPNISIVNSSVFKDESGFSLYYEKILGDFPVDEESYYGRARSHFGNLLFHEDCYSTLFRVNDGFCNYSKEITKCLSALNLLSPIEKQNTKDLLSNISAKVSCACTSQGSSHANFKFSFKHKENEYPTLDCQYHLKPSGRNEAGNNSHNHKRIYFGFIPEGENKLRIAVAAIGPHISTHSSDRYAPEKTTRKKVRRKGNS